MLAVIVFLLIDTLACPCTAQQAAPAAIPTVIASGTASKAENAPSPAPAKPREDWSNLLADRNELTPLVNGLSMGEGKFSTYTRELVRLEWRRGDPIDIYIVKPQGIAKPKVILYLYGFPNDSDRFMDDGWCKRETKDGYAAVGFVSALTGVRFRNRPMKEWFISELLESMSSSTHDVQLILDYLQKRPDLSADQVGMFGQGSGASIAILAASVDPRIQALDLLNPWGDWPDWLHTSPVVPDQERDRYLTPEFLQKVTVVDPINYLPQLKNRALRVQQTMDDPESPTRAQIKVAAATPSGDLVQFKDAEAHREAWKAHGLTGWLAEQQVMKQQGAMEGVAKKLP